MSDATHKTNYEGFPVLVVGVIDLDGKFHPTDLSVSSNEREEDYGFLFEAITTSALNLLAITYQPDTLIAN